MASPRFIVPVRRGSARPLCLVHSVAGELTWMPHLAGALAAGQPLYGFAAAGLNADAPFFSSLPEMAAAYLRDLRELQPQGPYMIGGYSMGGVVAYEMACQLQACGEEVALLALIDAFAPHPQRAESICRWSRNGLLMQVVANQLALQWGASVLMQPEVLASTPYSGHSAVAASHLLAHTGTRHTFGSLQPYLRRCQTIMRVHTELLASYIPRSLPDPVPAVLFRAAQGLIGRDSRLKLPVLPEAERAPPHRWDTLLAHHDTVDIDEEHFMMGGAAVMHRIAAAVTPYLAGVATVSDARS